MPKTLLVVERKDEFCECEDITLLTWRVGQWCFNSRTGDTDFEHCPNGCTVREATPADLAEALFGDDFADTLERVRFQADDLTHRMQNPEDKAAYERFAEALGRVRKSQPAKGDSDADQAP